MEYEKTTTRLGIRRATPDDADFFLRLLNSEGWLRYIGDRHVHSPEEAREYIENRILPQYDYPGHGSYLIALRETDVPLGFVGVFRRDTLPAPDFGFAFLPEGQGRGYAREASVALLATPEINNLPELLAIVLPENLRSIRLLEALGFRPDGTVRLSDDLELLKYRRV